MLAGAGVAALVGVRAYPAVRPQGSPLPALVYQLVSSPGAYHMGGVSGLRSARVQVDVYGASYAEGQAVADAVELALSGASGLTGATDFRGVFLDARRDGFDPAQEEGSRVHRVSMDWVIRYRSA